MEPNFKIRKRVCSDAPDETIETEAKKHLQSLAKKQITTNVTLQQQFTQHREFTGTSAFKSSVDDLVGVISLAEYQNTSNVDDKKDELGRYGLTQDEIKLKLKYENGNHSNEVSKDDRYGVNPDVVKHQLHQISEKISKKQASDQLPLKYSNTLLLTRNELDLEKAICSENPQNHKLSKFLLAQKDHDKTNPLSMVPDIMAEIDHKIKRHNEDRRKKRRQLKKEEKFSAIDCDNKNAIENENSIETHQTSCIVAENKNNVECLQNPVFIGPLPKWTPRLSCPIEITQKIQQVPESDIFKNKLTIAEIRQIDKFERYTEGEVNNVLYIKNIHPQATEEDIISLFGRFDSDSKVNYKLMTGRMRGQAFITFPDNKSAKEALELINGYKLKNKPLIIHYGNSQKPKNMNTHVHVT